jgi:hypothetical protein
MKSLVFSQGSGVQCGFLATEVGRHAAVPPKVLEAPGAFE